MYLLCVKKNWTETDLPCKNGAKEIESIRYQKGVNYAKKEIQRGGEKTANAIFK